MYPLLLFSHSVIRWLVVITLFFAIYRGIKGWRGSNIFSKTDDSIRHITVTFSHIQLTIGYILYFTSPFIAYFRSNFKEAIGQFEFKFFGIIHVLLMTVAVMVITIGSSVSKKQENDHEKFKTMTLFYIAGALIIFIAIPWPFSPLSARPYFRPLW